MPRRPLSERPKRPYLSQPVVPPLLWGEGRGEGELDVEPADGLRKVPCLPKSCSGSGVMGLILEPQDAMLDKLARIEDAVGIKGALHGAMQGAHFLRYSQRPPALLGQANAVLAGDGAAPGDDLRK